LEFAKEYSHDILAIDVNIDTDTMLDIAWELFQKYMKKEEIGIRDDLMNIYWKKRMKINFQYNKISQLQLIKQLEVREKALPTLKNKESALRLEVKPCPRRRCRAGTGYRSTQYRNQCTHCAFGVNSIKA